MWYIIWMIAVIGFTKRIKNQLIKLDKESIEKTTYTEEVILNGEQKQITKDKCPRCGNTVLQYKDTIKTEKSGYRVAVCDFCGTSFKARREPSSINGIFAFGFSLAVCTLAAVAIRMLVVLI